MKNEKQSIRDYLDQIGMDEEDIENILGYINNDIDKKILHEKIKYLNSLGLDARQIRIIIEEDIIFLTEKTELIIANGEILKKYLDEDEMKIALETTPELLTLKKDTLETNIRLLSILISDKEVLKVILQDRGEIVTYEPNYLSDKLSFFVSNGLKDKILNMMIKNIEIFELDNDEIDLEDVRKM